MLVTYKLYDSNSEKPFKTFTKHICFYMLFEYNWRFMKLKLYTKEYNQDYFDFWKKFILTLHPELTISRNYIKIPYLGRGKTLILCTAIRYLWETNNDYNNIPRMCKELIERFPNIDPFVALSIAASNTQEAGGWGHSLVHGLAEKLITTSEFNDYTGHTVHGLFNPSNLYYSYNIPRLDSIRESKANDTDLEPILKHFNYEQ